MAPSQLFDVLTIRPETANTSNVNYICLGGSSITGEQIRFLRRQFPYTKIIQTYGQTETCGGVTFIDPFVSKSVLDQKAASCGTPLNGICFKVSHNRFYCNVSASMIIFF